jgi:hypothetical protein
MIDAGWGGAFGVCLWLVYWNVIGNDISNELMRDEAVSIQHVHPT